MERPISQPQTEPMNAPSEHFPVKIKGISKKTLSKLLKLFNHNLEKMVFALQSNEKLLLDFGITDRQIKKLKKALL